MKRHMGALLLTLALLGRTTASAWGQGPEVGPGAGGATLRQPWQQGGTAPGSSTPSSPSMPAANLFATNPYAAKPAANPLGEMWNQSPSDTKRAMPTFAADINKDIEVTQQQGPWMVFIHSYEGNDAPQLARTMAMELRNTYRLQAFVFNYVAEEKRKEFERIQAEVAKQREAFKTSGLPLMDEKIHVRTVRIKDHCAILIGGFASEEAARRALVDIKKLPGPDPMKVALDTRSFAEEDAKNPGVAKKAERLYVNPFTRARLVSNPTIKRERAPEPPMDVAALRQMNSEEDFSLFRCRKNYTLAVKEFVMQGSVQDRAPSKAGLLASLGFGKGVQSDVTAQNAHNMAEALRKVKLDAYVLHTKHASIVTVGGFDSLDDPNLAAMQNLLAARFNNEAMSMLQMLPRAMPMAIPK